jgi:hypothetical protein
MSDRMDLTRRNLLKLTSGMLASAGLSKISTAEKRHVNGRTVRDCFWLFGVPANVNFPYLHRRSLMTPAEGALYLSIPNIIMVQVQDKAQGVVYEGYQPPYEQYALALRPFERVAWSIVESGGVTAADRRDQIINMAIRTPNMVGLYMDDFFHPNKTPMSSLTLAQLRAIRERIAVSGKKLELMVTFYTKQLDLPVAEYFRLIDVVALWTWGPSDLVNLQTNLTKLAKLAPTSTVFLGCYFYDFGTRQPVSVDAMKLQCETGLHWLREGRIAGMIFLGNSVEDQGFDCVEWTREWIQKVGNTVLAS